MLVGPTPEDDACEEDVRYTDRWTGPPESLDLPGTGEASARTGLPKSWTDATRTEKTARRTERSEPQLAVPQCSVAPVVGGCAPVPGGCALVPLLGGCAPVHVPVVGDPDPAVPRAAPTFCASRQ